MAYWITWHGDATPPVPEDTMVELQLRGLSFRTFKVRAGDIAWWHGDPRPPHDPHPADIMAYRVIEK